METTPTLTGFSLEDAPKKVDLNRCIHCGLCLPFCPTYRLTGMEMSSPRGRIAMMRGIADLEVSLGDKFDYQMFFCLACRACETACPSGVEYGKLVEAGRAQTVEHAVPKRWDWLKRLILKRIFPFPGRLKLMFRLIRLYQRSGLQWFVRNARLLSPMPGDLEELEQLLPSVPSRFFSDTVGEVVPGQGEKRHRVGLLSGCVMDTLLADANAATVRVLTRNGCEVVIPKGQCCCGALHAHTGDLETARSMARRNIDAFEAHELDAIVVNAAGCGSTMKEYDRLLEDDLDYASRAAAFAAKVQDIAEYLVEIGIDTDSMHPMEVVATYDEPCHLIHAQKISDAPKILLRSIPGVDLVPLREADWCCGSAGIYNITHFRESMELLAEKMQNIRETGAEVVATGNAGCLLQIGYGARRHGLTIRVVHPVQLLDEAYNNIPREGDGGR